MPRHSWTDRCRCHSHFGTSTTPTIFEYNSTPIRVITIDGEPWFVARDVCFVLNMDLYAGTSQWTRALSADERRVATRKELPEIFSGSRAGSLAIISESGLYKLIMRSDKPSARKFQDWVTRDVLPTIRKTGAYSAPGVETIHHMGGLGTTAGTCDHGMGNGVGSNGEAPKRLWWPHLAYK